MCKFEELFVLVLYLQSGVFESDVIPNKKKRKAKVTDADKEQQLPRTQIEAKVRVKNANSTLSTRLLLTTQFLPECYSTSRFSASLRIDRNRSILRGVLQCTRQSDSGPATAAVLLRHWFRARHAQSAATVRLRNGRFSRGVQFLRAIRQQFCAFDERRKLLVDRIAGE